MRNTNTSCLVVTGTFGLNFLIVSAEAELQPFSLDQVQPTCTENVFCVCVAHMPVNNRLVFVTFSIFCYYRNKSEALKKNFNKNLVEINQTLEEVKHMAEQGKQKIEDFVETENNALKNYHNDKQVFYENVEKMKDKYDKKTNRTNSEDSNEREIMDKRTKKTESDDESLAVVEKLKSSLDEIRSQQKKSLEKLQAVYEPKKFGKEEKIHSSEFTTDTENTDEKSHTTVASASPGREKMDQRRRSGKSLRQTSPALTQSNLSLQPSSGVPYFVNGIDTANYQPQPFTTKGLVASYQQEAAIPSQLPKQGITLIPNQGSQYDPKTSTLSYPLQVPSKTGTGFDFTDTKLQKSIPYQHEVPLQTSIQAPQNNPRTGAGTYLSETAAIPQTAPGYPVERKQETLPLSAQRVDLFQNSIQAPQYNPRTGAGTYLLETAAIPQTAPGYPVEEKQKALALPAQKVDIFQNSIQAPQNDLLKSAATYSSKATMPSTAADYYPVEGKQGTLALPSQEEGSFQTLIQAPQYNPWRGTGAYLSKAASIPSTAAGYPAGGKQRASPLSYQGRGLLQTSVQAPQYDPRTDAATYPSNKTALPSTAAEYPVGEKQGTLPLPSQGEGSFQTRMQAPEHNPHTDTSTYPSKTAAMISTEADYPAGGKQGALPLTPQGKGLFPISIQAPQYDPRTVVATYPQSIAAGYPVEGKQGTLPLSAQAVGSLQTPIQAPQYDPRTGGISYFPQVSFEERVKQRIKTLSGIEAEFLASQPVQDRKVGGVKYSRPQDGDQNIISSPEIPQMHKQGLLGDLEKKNAYFDKMHERDTFGAEHEKAYLNKMHEREPIGGLEKKNSHFNKTQESDLFGDVQKKNASFGKMHERDTLAALEKENAYFDKTLAVI